MEQPDSAAYLIVDSEHVRATRATPLVPLIDGWETVAEMETALGLPAGSVASDARPLQRARRARRGPGLPQGRRTGSRRRTPGPWAAFDLTLGKAMYAGFTLGGIRVTVDGQAQRPDGSVIPGLYAAGACASNLAQDGKGYCSGTQLGEGSFFGRRAGRHAAGVSPAGR